MVTLNTEPPRELSTREVAMLVRGEGGGGPFQDRVTLGWQSTVPIFASTPRDKLGHTEHVRGWGVSGCFFIETL